MYYVTRKKNFGKKTLDNSLPGDTIVVVCDKKEEMQQVVQTCYNTKDRNECPIAFKTKKLRDDLFVEIKVINS